MSEQDNQPVNDQSVDTGVTTETPKKPKREKRNRKRIITQKMVERAKRGTVFWDAKTTGLCIEKTPGGKESYKANLTYPGHGSQTIRTLPVHGLKEAREKIGEWRKLIDQGIDPRDAEEDARRAADQARLARAKQDAQTFAAAAEAYVRARAASERNRRAATDANEIRRVLIPALGEKPIASITPADIKQLFTALMARAPWEARNCWTHCVGIFKAAVFAETLVASPCASIDKRQLFRGAKLSPRQRVLSDDELRAFWRASTKLHYPYGPYFKLLLLVGVRRNELAGARWSEFSPQLRQALRESARSSTPVNWQQLPEHKLWTIPAERFKSGVVHLVPLPTAALEILAQLPRWSGGDSFLFSTTSGRTPINGLSKAKGRLDRLMLRSLRAMARLRGENPNTAALPPFVCHDLRRCIRTGLSALGVEDHISEMTIGHGRRGIQRVYDQHKYEPQVRAALERWAERLAKIVQPPSPAHAPDNVVRLMAK